MSIERKIRNDIEARIRSGEWRPGHRIPFEHELVGQYGCARATVSKALAVLARDGLIERRRRAGSFVAFQQFQSAALEIPDIGAVIAARGEAYRFRLDHRQIRPADPASQDEARLVCGGPMLHIEGLHLANETGFATETRIISLHSVPSAAEVDFTTVAPGSWLLEHVPWTHARHRISAVRAGSEGSRVLMVPSGEPCLSIERWTWRQGAAVTFARQVFPGNRHDLIAEFSPNN